MMKKILIGVVVFALFVMPLAAASIEVEEIDHGSTVVSEINNQVFYDLVIDNKGTADSFTLFSLIGLSITPDKSFLLSPGKTIKEINATAPETILDKPGLYLLEYQIKGQNSGLYKDKLKVRIIPMKEAFEIKTGDIRIDDSEVNVTIKNLANARIQNTTMRLKSEFFDFTAKFSLEPFGSASFVKPLDRESIKKLVAGPYVITASVSNNGKEAKAEGVAIYLESSSVKTDESSAGFVIRKNTVKKTNEGNIPLTVEIRMKRDIITRLITSYSLEPTIAERGALTTTYSWVKEIGPQSSLEVVSTTNYTFPLVLLALVVLIGLLVRIYLRTDLVLNKRVSYVKTRGGEFALKVRVHVKARKNVDNVNIVDRIPGMAKLYEHFAGKGPDKIDSEGRRLFWSIARLNAGEERVFSYIIYSKVKILGRFELPSATAMYHTDNKGKGSVESNRTYFVAEAANTADEF